MINKRTRFLGVRVSEEEYKQLKERCGGRQLAAWMRQVCLDERPRRSTRLPSIDPALLRQLAGIGNNLNQVARKINGGVWSGADSVQIVSALMVIERDLKELRRTVENGKSDDC